MLREMSIDNLTRSEASVEEEDDEFDEDFLEEDQDFAVEVSDTDEFEEEEPAEGARMSQSTGWKRAKETARRSLPHRCWSPLRLRRLASRGATSLDAGKDGAMDAGAIAIGARVRATAEIRLRINHRATGIVTRAGVDGRRCRRPICLRSPTF